MIYLDYNATTPVDKRVMSAMIPFFEEEFANPASDHIKGQSTRERVEKNRSEIASFIGARNDEIIFTSGATESNNLALIGLALKQKNKKNHIITSKIEHHAILMPCKYLETLGYKLTYIDVDKNGFVDLDQLRCSINKETLLISIMFANNEIGSIQPIKEIGDIARRNGILFHTDAAQAVGHIDIDVDELNIDLLSASAHKFYGPKGIGFLFARNRVPRVSLSPVIHGGGQERGFRSGTLNVPGIVGLAEACRIAKNEMHKQNDKFRFLTRQIVDELLKRRDDISINGHLQKRLPHTINLEIPNVDNKWLSMKMKEFCFSTGSACSNIKDEPSHVLLALGLNEKRTQNCVRIGVGPNTTEKEVSLFLEELKKFI